MNKFQKLGAALLLTGTLSLSASAGQIEIGYDPTPHPTPTPQTVEGDSTTGVYGNMHTTNSDEAAAGDAVVAGALSLLQGVLSLL